VFRRTFDAFFRLEAAGGILLLIAAGPAMLLQNPPAGPQAARGFGSTAPPCAAAPACG